MRNIQVARIGAAVALFGALTVNAAVTAEEADRLGRDLTPVGAERAGNAAGTIPAWTGGWPRSRSTRPSATRTRSQDPILFTITGAERRSSIASGCPPGSWRCSNAARRSSA